MTGETDTGAPARTEYLIVDDEPDLCWSLKNILHSKGLRSHAALSAMEALALMKRHRFRLAFLDVTLPDMNGFELARRLRQMDPELRLVLVSGFLSADPAAVAHAHDASFFYGCIIKPFLHEDVLGLIDSDDHVQVPDCGHDSA
ncbi:MAG: response regulator [Opitutaceae bacterium]|nr:response regulator [Opitutaceae bacterium]